MSWRVPDWWKFLLLTLAAFRIYRLVARDTITEPLRAAVSFLDRQKISLGDDPAEKMEVVGDAEIPKSWRVYLSTLIRCPWCAGFYVSAGAWGAWEAWPRPALFVAVPWAVSAAVALAEKNLDR